VPYDSILPNGATHSVDELLNVGAFALGLAVVRDDADLDTPFVGLEHRVRNLQVMHSSKSVSAPRTREACLLTSSQVMVKTQMSMVLLAPLRNPIMVRSELPWS
jgi:hypothetical protein